MSAAPSTPAARRPGIAPALLLALAAALLAYLGTLPVLLGVGLALVLSGSGGALRALSHRRARAMAPLPALAALVLGAVASPLGLLPELVAGVAGVAFLAWLADDPTRPAGGVGRARTTLLVPSLSLGIAWASALLLPSGSASIGVAAGLLVAALVALALLVARPGVIDREPAATS